MKAVIIVAMLMACAVAIVAPPPPSPTTTTPATTHPTFPPYTPPHCPAVMPAYTMWFPMIYQGNIQYYDWLISLTNRSSDTPNAADAACPPSFIGQYSRGKSNPDACVVDAAVSALDTRLGCMWTFSQTYNAITQNFYVTVDCDQKATTMQAPAAFLVTPAGPNTYTYTGTFRSNLVC